MTTFKVIDQNHPLHNREFEEYTQFKRYNGGVEWIPLLIGANQVKFFALCNLREVRQPNMTDLDYCYPQPTFMQVMVNMAAAQLELDIADALALWRKIVFVPDAPVVRLEPDELMSVNDSRNVTVVPATAA